MPDIKRRGLSRTPACCYMVVGVYGELCSSAGCRLPLDVVDRIIYVHSDIDTRLRVRAPPRRIPGSVLRAVAALFVPVAASRAFVDTGKRVASGGAPRALSSVGVSRTWVGLRIIMVFGDVVGPKRCTFLVSWPLAGMQGIPCASKNQRAGALWCVRRSTEMTRRLALCVCEDIFLRESAGHVIMSRHSPMSPTALGGLLRGVSGAGRHNYVGLREPGVWALLCVPCSPCCVALSPTFSMSLAYAEGNRMRALLRGHPDTWHPLESDPTSYMFLPSIVSNDRGKKS